MTSNAYTDDFIETRDYGRSSSTVRTPEQTDIAISGRSMATFTGTETSSTWP